MKNSQSRRKFITTAVLGTVAAVITPSVLGAEKEEMNLTVIPKEAFGANDRIRVAMLGVNGRGSELTSNVMRQENVVVAILCDPDMDVLKYDSIRHRKIVSTENGVKEGILMVEADWVDYSEKPRKIVYVQAPYHSKNRWFCYR